LGQRKCPFEGMDRKVIGTLLPLKSKYLIQWQPPHEQGRQLYRASQLPSPRPQNSNQRHAPSLTNVSLNGSAVKQSRTSRRRPFSKAVTPIAPLSHTKRTMKRLAQFGQPTGIPYKERMAQEAAAAAAIATASVGAVKPTLPRHPTSSISRFLSCTLLHLT